MKQTYPFYIANKSNPESKKVFETLSQTNKNAIIKFMDIVSTNSQSHKRLDNAQRGLIRFLDFLEKDWNEITYSDFIAVSKAISNSKLGTYTRNGDRNFIKRFLQENFEDWRTRFKDLKVMKLETKSEEHKLSHKDLITEKELEKMIKATSNMKHKTMIILLFESGCRPEELLKLRWSDLDFKKGMVYLYSAKTKKKRGIPIKNSVAHLNRLFNETEPKENDFMFPSIHTKTEIITNSGLNSLIDNIRKKAKISRKITGYTFRHTRLSELITKLSPKVYEDISGHSLAMGMKTYAHLSEEKLIKEMKENVFEVEDLTDDEKNELIKKVNQLEAEMKKLKLDLYNAQGFIFEDKKK